MQPYEQYSLGFSLALENAKSGVWNWNIKDSTVFFSPNYFKISGYPPDAFPHSYEEWKQRVHPEDIATIKKMMHQYLAGESEFYAAEYRFKTNNAGWMWVLDQGEVVERNEDGEPVHFTGIHIDASQFHLANEALKLKADKYRDLYENAPIPYQSLTKDGFFINITPAWLKTLGYEREEVIGNYFADFLHPDSKQTFEKNFPAFIELGQVHDIQLKIRHKDGHYLDISFEGSTGYTSAGEFKQTYCIFQDIAVRKQAETKLQGSEKKFYTLFNSSPVPTYTWKRDGNDFTLLDYNRAAMDFTANKIADLVGIKASNLYEDEPQILENFEQCYQHQSILEREMDYQLKTTGANKFLNVKYTFVPPDLVMIHTEDFTDRKRAETKLKESEIKFRLLADYTYDWEYWIDPKGKYLYLSPSCERITGYSPEEFMTNPQLFYEIVHPDYLEMLHQHYTDENNRECPAFSMEFPIITKSGETRWLEHNCSPVFENHDTYAGRRGNNRDITDRKQAESMLAQSEKSFRAIFNQAAVGIAQVGTDGSWLRVNQKLCDILGYTRNELLGLAFQEITFEEDLQADLEYLQKMRTGDITTFSREKRYRRKDRELVWVNLSVSMVPDNTGKPDYFISVVEDISERVAAERQLRQKSKIEAVGLLAGGMAHNFNNNLSIVLGNVELANLKAQKNSEVSELLNNAKVGIMRSRDLIQQIMAYSRTSEQRKEVILLAEIIDETLKLLLSTIPSTIHLQYQPPPDNQQIMINATATHIQEALLNLCNNAVHAMDEKGTLTLTLETAAVQKADIPEQYEECVPGNFAVIRVQDTGYGMTIAVKDKIFDPFFTTKGVDEGTGMGLATVQGVLKVLGGMIKVDSVLGQGTTFELYFPTVSEPVIEALPNNLDLPRGAEKILFIDDDEMLVQLGEMMLSEVGYRVVTMTESTEALKLFTANSDYFDLVITDQTMPNLSGIDLIQELLKIRPDLPIILCTGFSTKVDKDEAKKLGVKAFGMKPLDMPNFLQEVRRVLDGEREAEDKHGGFIS